MSFAFKPFLELFVRKFKIKYDCSIEKTIGFCEIQIVDKLLDLFEDIVEMEEYDVEDDEDLIMMEIEDNIEDSEADYSDGESEESEELKEISFEYMQKVVKYHKDYPRRGLKSIQSRFRLVKSSTQIHRWEKYIEEKGRKTE